MGDGFGLLSALEPAFVVQGDGRTVGGCDPQRQATRSTFVCPPDHRVHETDATPAPRRSWRNKHPTRPGRGSFRSSPSRGRPGPVPNPASFTLATKVTP